MKNPTFLLLYIILSYCTAASAQQEKIFHSYDSSAKHNQKAAGYGKYQAMASLTLLICSEHIMAHLTFFMDT